MATPPEKRSSHPPIQATKYGRYVAIVGVIFLIVVTVNTMLTKPNGAAGVPKGERVPPFAVPLATGDVEGYADVAVKADEGERGKVPACGERGRGILNICELYEEGPVVLALFVNAGSCPGVLSEMQALAPSFPSVSFAAVAIKEEREPLLKLVHRRGVTLPVGFDYDGILAGLYKVASCPQVSFIYPGGVVQSHALLGKASKATLRRRVAALVAASKARIAGANTKTRGS